MDFSCKFEYGHSTTEYPWKTTSDPYYSTTPHTTPTPYTYYPTTPHTTPTPYTYNPTTPHTTPTPYTDYPTTPTPYTEYPTTPHTTPTPYTYYPTTPHTTTPPDELSPECRRLVGRKRIRKEVNRLTREEKSVLNNAMKKAMNLNPDNGLSI